MIRLQDNLHHEKLIFNFNSMVECSGFIFLPNHATITSLLLKRISSFLNHSFAQQYGLNMMLKSDDGLVLLARSMVPSYPSMMADVVKVVAAVCLVK